MTSFCLFELIKKVKSIASIMRNKLVFVIIKSSLVKLCQPSSLWKKLSGKTFSVWGFVMNESPDLSNESYILYDHVMNPLTAHQERKTRKDRVTRRGRHSTSSSSTFDQPSSSHLNDDDDDGNG
ncbi:hypothetical protein Tco_0112159 [Tanacetum coccineum]